MIRASTSIFVGIETVLLGNAGPDQYIVHGLFANWVTASGLTCAWIPVISAPVQVLILWYLTWYLQTENRAFA